MDYETKMRMLANVKPEFKDLILARILSGERKVPITGDEDIFFQVNKDRVTLEQFTERDKFKKDAEIVKQEKKGLFDPKYGNSKGKKMRWLGDIPAEIYFSRPEFSPLLSKEERAANIRKFFNKYPQFRAGDKQI